MVAPDTYTAAAHAANAIWDLLDRRRYDDILSYLTADCAWQRTEGWRHGHAEVLASFQARPADLLTRHFATNFTVELAADGSLVGQCYVTAYVAKTAEQGATQPMDQPLIIADVDFEFVRSGDSVLISKVSVHPTFAVRDPLK